MIKELKIVFIIQTLFIAEYICETFEWNYKNQEEWDQHFQHCNGTNGSPININTTQVKLDSNLGLSLYNYDRLFFDSLAQNNGHTVRVTLNPIPLNQMPSISGPAVNYNQYILDSFHFHWGLNSINGSEHSINGLKSSAELHLVHWNRKYGNLSNAMEMKDGLVVLTVFIETKMVQSFGFIEAFFDNQYFQPIVEVLPKIRDFGTKSVVRNPIYLRGLLPSFMNQFYTYMGSLTTPPCSETVTFIIFGNPVLITARQLSEFRQISAEPVDGVPYRLTENTRGQQPLNGRTVYLSDWRQNNIRFV